MSRDQCQARVYDGGHRCQFAAKHRHRIESGDVVRVCSVHLRMLTSRERNRSPEEVVARWREQ